MLVVETVTVCSSVALVPESYDLLLSVMCDVII